MTPIARLLTVSVFAPLFTACGAIAIGPNVSLAHGGWLGTSWFVDDGKVGSPAVSTADYHPPGGPMTVHTAHIMPFELDLAVDLRLRLLPGFYTGITSNYLSLYNDNLDNACTSYNCQTVRYSTVDWWDNVLAEDVIVKRSPSIGWEFGMLFGNKEMPGLFEYSISVRKYDVLVGTYEGINCINCVNGSRMKSQTTVESGALWRNTFKLGFERLHGVGWVEFGSNLIAMGLGIEVTNPIFEEEK